MSESLGEWDDEPDDAPAGTMEAAEEEPDAPELFYPNVAEFVSNKLAVSYRRQLNVQGGVTWCPQWWKHAEAISRLEALWRAWEFLRLDGTTGMSVWWRDHADHHMAVLLDPQNGPFGPVDGEHDRNRHGEPLPYTAPPEGMFSDVRSHTARDRDSVNYTEPTEQ